MNNNSLWYSSLQSTENSLQMPPSIQSTAISWSFSQPMQVQVTTQLNANYNYQDIAKNFLEKYTSANIISFFSVDHYYDTNSSISLHLHQSSSNILHEIIGFNNFRDKMAGMNVYLIKYSNLVFTSQPIGENGIVISFHGKAEINGVLYNVLSTLVLRIISGTPKITNQILNIFF